MPGGDEALANTANGKHQDMQMAAEYDTSVSANRESRMPQVADGSFASLLWLCRERLRELSLRVLRCVPVVGQAFDRPRLQPLVSSHRQMLRWVRAPYGSPGKPASLADIPWNYVRKYEDTIPFTGLREYWYPALKSGQLRHNEVKPVTMLGDHLVFFRSADGRPRALVDRCPHRGVLLSLGQVGVWQPGTLTCRYHGMTFDGTGECVAFLADGPDSPACGKIRARSYPTEEVAGIVWVYMGDKEPAPVLDSIPHAREVLTGPALRILQIEWPFSHLNTLDNDIDLAHPSCLHRTCIPLSGQKLWGRVSAAEQPCGGIRASYVDDVPHAGKRHIDEIEWHLPNFAYFAPDTFLPNVAGYFWAVPKDIGNSVAWAINGVNSVSLRYALAFAWFMGRFIPGSPRQCVDASDAGMMASQGRIADWSRDRLTRTDAPVAKARLKLREAFALEQSERKNRMAGRSADD